MNAQDILDVELMPGTKFVKRILCKLCGERVFEVSDNPSLAEIDIERAGVAAHMEFRHGLALSTVKCSDQKCLGDH